MSEPMFPEGNASHAAPAPADAGESGGNRKTLLVLGGVVAALVVGGGAFLLMNSGSGDAADEALVVPPAAVNNPVDAAPPAAAAPAVKPASVTIAKRDPFAPLYAAPAPASSTTPGGDPGVEPTTPPSSGGSTSQDPSSSTPASVQLSVRVIDTKGQAAGLSVDSKKYNNVRVGESFGTYYTLYSIFNSQCVGVLYGDQSVPLCLGKPVTVTP